MQQTALDHFLRKKFVYRYEISCNRIPPSLPDGVALTPGVDNDHGKWGYLLECRDEDAYHDAIALLRSNRILFFPTIAERGGVIGHVLNPPSYSSFTWNSVWGGARMVLTSVFGGAIPRFLPMTLLEASRNAMAAVRLLF